MEHEITTEMSDHQRMTRIEASIDEIKLTISKLSDAVAEGQKTNWPTMIAGVTLLLILYGAAIAPMNADLVRHEQILLERGSRIQDIENRQFGVMSRLMSLENQFEIVREEGSPTTRNRLAVIEYRLGIRNGGNITK